MDQITTLHDVVAHVLDVFDVQGDEVEYRRAIRSAQWGFQMASTRHRWVSYDTEHLARLNASVTEGTIDISSAGVVTRTGFVWPDWAAQGVIVIEDDVHRVAARLSDETLRLESWDFRSLTEQSYTLGHNRILLPHDVRTIFDAWDETGDYRLLGMDVVSFRDRDRWQLGSPGAPTYYTTRQVTLNGRVRTEVRVTPFPSIDSTIRFTYLRSPIQPILVHPLGLVSTAAGVVTLDTSLPDEMDATGAWLRVSSTQTSPDANLAYSMSNPSDISWQGEVLAQTNTTTLQIEASAPNVTQRGAILTDLIDLPWFAVNAAKMYAEAQMHRMGRADTREYNQILQHADQELRFAMEMEGQIDRRSIRAYSRAETFSPTPYLEGHG